MMRYAEMQVTTHFSFLRGASSADELFAAAAALGIDALGVVDRNSLAGIVRAWEAAKTTGVRLVGTHLRATHDYRKVESQAPTVLVMGNEQAGMTEEMTAACDVRVKIPMAGRADSLNLAVATGVMLYELRRGQLN